VSAQLATLALALLLVTPAPPDGHRQMLERLEQVAAESADANPYTGDLQARTFRRFAATPSGGGGLRRWTVLRELGHHELRLGNEAVAAERFAEAWEMVPSLGVALRPEDVDRIQLDLAIAHLRWGESRNCVARHTAESCIAPLAASAVHQDQEGSRRAIAKLESLLRRRPDHLTARWLLNVAYMTIGGYPDQVPAEWRVPPAVFESEETFPRFVDRGRDAGLGAPDLGGGAAVDDFDGDGRLDLVLSSPDPTCDLRLHAGTPGGFEDRSAAAGLVGLRGGANLVLGDYDNDGDADLLVLRGAWLGRNGQHPRSLLRNDGGGRFVDVTFAAGLGEPFRPSQTAAWADYDNDGDLDLYVGNEWSDNQRFPAQLYRNRGDGTFEDVAALAGVENRRLAKGVAWVDVDADRFPDLYVSNLNGDNRLYRNRGDGTFEDIAAAAGVTRPWSSLAVAVLDFDNDGQSDLFVGATSPGHGTEVVGNRSDELAPLSGAVALALGDASAAKSVETSRLYRGLGGGRFEDVSQAQGLGRAVLTGGIGVGDLDADGFTDLYLGKVYPGFEGLLPNKLYRNRGGAGFADVTTAAGMGHLQKAGGIAVADLDGDGDQDVLVNAGGMYRGDTFGDLLFSNPGNGNHWLEIRLVGRRSNRAGVGARVRARVTDGGGTRWIEGTAGAGGSFGANPRTVRLGLGRAAVVDELQVYWPTSDRRQELRQVAADRTIEIVEPGSEPLAPAGE